MVVVGSMVVSMCSITENDCKPAVSQLAGASAEGTCCMCALTMHMLPHAHAIQGCPGQALGCTPPHASSGRTYHAVVPPVLGALYDRQPLALDVTAWRLLGQRHALPISFALLHILLLLRSRRRGRLRRVASPIGLLLRGRRRGLRCIISPIRLLLGLCVASSIRPCLGLLRLLWQWGRILRLRQRRLLPGALARGRKLLLLGGIGRGSAGVVILLGCAPRDDADAVGDYLGGKGAGHSTVRPYINAVKATLVSTDYKQKGHPKEGVEACSRAHSPQPKHRAGDCA